MKIRIQLSIIFIAALSTSVSAQWTFGIQGGFNNSWQTGAVRYNDDATGNAHLKGMVISVPVFKQLNKHLQFGIEPGVVQRGTKEGNDVYSDLIFVDPTSSFFGRPFISSFIYTGSLNTSYFQLPVMVKLHAPLVAGKFSFYVKGGAGLSWLASAYEESGNFSPESQNGGFISKVDLRKNDNYNRTDFGLYGGAGFSIKAGVGHLTIGTDTYAGFISVKRYGGSQNRSLSYSLGYLIDLQ